MLKNQLQLKLQQKLSPQQIQLMKLLQVPTAELEQRIKDEIQDNPALEEGADFEDEDPTEQDIESEENDNEEDFDLSDYIQHQLEDAEVFLTLPEGTKIIKMDDYHKVPVAAMRDSKINKIVE